MIAQPKTSPERPPEPPDAAEFEGGAYSSPPCFMHELDPGFLGLPPQPVPAPDPSRPDDATTARPSVEGEADGRADPPRPSPGGAIRGR